jgi:hypothetical protein
MRYPLRTLLLCLTFGPPVLAIAWWSLQWLLGHQLHPTLCVILIAAYLLGSLSGPFLLYGELMRLLCGPDSPPQRQRKTRRKVRVRIERYAGGTTWRRHNFFA